MNDIQQKLAGGDRRSIGRADEVVADVLNDLSLFEALFQGMLSDDPIIRMRSADAAAKITAKHPECLQPCKDLLIGEVAASAQQEVRWHVAQMLPRLELNARERAVAVEILLGYLDDKSAIVRTNAMQALANFAEMDERYRDQVVVLLRRLTEMGTPAMVSRGRRLLKRLEQP
jgi:hypothetical protein